MVVYEGARGNSHSFPSLPPPSFHFHNILSWEYYSQKPWIIPYPCHLVPFSERECQPNVKREVMIHLDSEERIFLHNTPMSLLVFSPSLQLLSLIDCWYVAQNYLNVVNLFSVSSSPVISWPSLLIFFSNFPLLSEPETRASRGLTSILWNKIKWNVSLSAVITSFQNNRGFGIMYLTAKPHIIN